VAVGVGSSKIVGRIHQAPLNVAGERAPPPHPPTPSGAPGPPGCKQQQQQQQQRDGGGGGSPTPPACIAYSAPPRRRPAGHFLTCSITVLEQKDGPQFIFGLDMLRRHLCCIDMQRSELRFGSCSAALPFLPEHQIPRDFKRHIDAVSQKEAEENMAGATKDGGRPGADRGAGGPLLSARRAGWPWGNLP
jgi:hypothetical protein